tara:strand:- start:64 stop:342 length:279 start_codon:yes stop_codon:yes gene_type:complete
MSDIVEVKPKRSEALKKAQKKYMNNLNPDKKQELLIKRRKQYETKKKTHKEDKEMINILKEDMKKQSIKINTLEDQKLQLIELKKIIDNLLN